jgi:hypothetical protein
MQNVAETDWAISTAGKGNSFNSNFKKCENHSQPGCGLSTSGNSWNLMAYRLDTLLSLKLSNGQSEALGLDGVEAFVHGRFWSDVAPYVDGALPAINAEGFRQRYAGSGWAAQVAEHEYELDAAEAYLDLHRGPLWIRLGKQQIVYGEELGIQTLDQGNHDHQGAVALAVAAADTCHSRQQDIGGFRRVLVVDNYLAFFDPAD